MSERIPLAGSFEPVFQRVCAEPADQACRVLAALAFALAAGEAFDLAQIDALPQSDQALSLALFDYCMSEGLTEDERAAAEAAFAPFSAMHATGTRH